MALELAALDVAIREKGGIDVLKRFDQIDQRGAAAAKRLGNMPVRTPGLDGAVEGVKRFARESERASSRIRQFGSTQGLDAINRRVGLLAQGLGQAATRAASLERLQAIERQLQGAIARGNLSLAERIRLEKVLSSTQAAIASAMARTTAALQARQFGSTAGLDAINQRIGLLTDGLGRTATRAASLQRLQVIERQLQLTIGRGNFSLAERIRLEGTLARVQDARLAATRRAIPTGALTATRGLGTAVGLGSAVAIGGVFAGITRATQAADDHQASLQKLSGTAKITGVELSVLQGIAASGEKEFRLSTVMANGYAVELAKLASKAGDMRQAAPALAAFLNIGAARGLSAEQTLVAVRQAILGIDEGTDKLFNKNPSVLYKEYADAIGTTVGKLTDQQKAQAIVNAALTDGAKVTTAYSDRLKTAQGRNEQLSQAIDKVFIALGNAIAGSDQYRSGTDALTGALEGLARTISENREGISGMVGELRQLLAALVSLLDLSVKLDRFGLILQGITNPGAALQFGRRERARRERAAAEDARILANDPTLNATLAPPTAAPGRRTKTKEEIEEEEKALKNLRAAQAEEITAILALQDLHKATGADLIRLTEIERHLTAELARGNVTRERRADIEGALNAIIEARPKLALAIDPTLLTEGEEQGPFDIREQIQAAIEKELREPLPIKVPIAIDFEVAAEQVRLDELKEDVAKAADAEFEQLGLGLADVLGAAVAAGFSGGSVGDAVLQGLGGIFQQMGQKLIAYGVIMSGLLPALKNPFTSGPAAIAAGILLTGLGAALGAIATGSGGPGGAGLRAPRGHAEEITQVTIVNRSTIKPSEIQPLAPFGPNYFFGPNDPVLQRNLQEAYKKANRRGGV